MLRQTLLYIDRLELNLTYTAQKARTFVELGAGKGFLSLALLDACDAKDVVLLDRDAFRLKADRRLLFMLVFCLFLI